MEAGVSGFGEKGLGTGFAGLRLEVWSSVFGFRFRHGTPSIFCDVLTC